MGNNCSCMSKDEPSEVTVDKKPGTRKEAAPAAEEAQPMATFQEKEQDKWTVAEVHLLQASVRSYLKRKQQRDAINKLVVLEWPDEPEPVTAKETRNVRVPEVPAEVKAKRDSLPPFQYSIKVLAGDLKPPVLMSDDSVYVGQWKDGQRYGKGVCYLPTGAVMEGYWSGGLHLKGRIIYPNGDHYEGDFVHMKKEGQGKFQNVDGTMSYEGGWAADLKQGQGVESMADGSRYEGQFEADQKKGMGKFTWKTGEVYEGEFLDSKIHGTGKYVWSETKWYEGSWFEGKMHGKGHLVQDGKDYEGDFVSDKKHGTGVLKWENNVYEGQFEGNKMHGQGWLSQKGKPKKLYAFNNNKRGEPITEPAN